MARFYGTVQGGRGRATRLGHASSGLHVTAQGFAGDIVVDLENRAGDDWVYIGVRPHDDCGGLRKTIYHGPMKQLVEQPARKTLIEGLLDEALLEG